jgi:HEAT repeat protein
LQHLFSRWPRASAGAGFLVVAALLGSGSLLRAGPLPIGPVEKLRQALKQDKGAGKSEEGEKHRRKTLKERVAAVRSLGDISQALLLEDWLDASLTERTFAIVDQEFRGELAQRFTTEVRRLLEKGDPTSQVAAAGLVGDTALLARARDIQSPAVLKAIDDLAKDLVRATNAADPRVRLQAIRSLGRIQVQEPATTIRPLGDLFGRKSRDDHRAAAEALNNIARILPRVRLRRAEGVTSGSEFALSRKIRIQASEALVPAAGKGLGDADPEVRRLCADTLFQIAVMLSDPTLDLIGTERREEDFPARDRPLTPAEKKRIEFFRDEVVQEREELKPLLNAFRVLSPAFASAAGDRNGPPPVRLLAIRTLEELGTARQRLLRRAFRVAQYNTGDGVDKEGGKEDKNTDKKKDDERGPNEEARLDAAEGIRYAAAGTTRLQPFRLPEGQDQVLQGLQKTIDALSQALINDPRADVRLAAVEALETLGDDAAPAAAELAKALSTDHEPDRFVRWAAARTVGRMSPDKLNIPEVVRNLIRMVDDPDLDLRVMAAESLEQLGPHAKAAVPALAKATGKGDAEIRRAAIRALTGIGTDATPAVPDIAAALSFSDVRVRRAAAEALSQFGALAQPAETDLRKALDDDDAEVRRHAEDALLKLQ